jgi:hypothetical protein
MFFNNVEKRFVHSAEVLATADRDAELPAGIELFAELDPEVRC